MSIVTSASGKGTDATLLPFSIGLKENEKNPNKPLPSPYAPTDEEKDARQMVLRHFVLGYMNMWTPRVELNDYSVVQRMQADQMSWNTYQQNDGQSMSADDIAGWRSNALRPIVRNRATSIAAHATARLLFPKIFAYNPQNQDQEDAAETMLNLMEWAADQSNYANQALYRVIAAMTDPVSIGYTEYAEVKRPVKRTKKNGKWVVEQMLDPNLSGFQDCTVPCDQFFIENFYEPDVQKQGWLIWRKVIGFDLAKAQYGKYPNFQYVKPGVQTLYSDANNSFYWVYDPNMRQYDVEVIEYWNKNLDVRLCLVNGVLLSDYDNPNPRLDKQYPFDVFGYSIINSRCFYYKSLVFHLQGDARIINTLYPMIIDGTYLNLMPPMINSGSEAIGSDVIVPGAVTTLSDPNAKLSAVKVGTDLKSGMDTLFKVEESINESSQDPLQAGQDQQGDSTAYQISRQEQNAATVLGLFIKMISNHVRSYGKLRMSDIIQYLTIAEASEIVGEEQTYKTFLLGKISSGKSKTRKIQFDMNTPDEAMPEDEHLNESFKILSQEGGPDSKMEIYKVNPELFRNLIYMVTVSPDVLNPRSEELERAFSLELFDRLIASPVANQEEALRLLLSNDPNTRRDPDKFIAKQQPTAPSPLDPGQLGGGSPPKGKGIGGKASPLAAIASKNPLSTSVQSTPQM